MWFLTITSVMASHPNHYIDDDDDDDENYFIHQINLLFISYLFDVDPHETVGTDEVMWMIIIIMLEVVVMKMAL